MTAVAALPSPIAVHAADRRRTSRSVQLSVLLHGVLLAWLSLHHTVSAPPEVLTEVTWAEAAPVVTPAAASPSAPSRIAPAPKVARVPSPAPSQSAFERQDKEASVAPEPQSILDQDARLSDRLASLRSGTSDSRVTPIGIATPSALVRASSGGTDAAAAALGRDGSSEALSRGPAVQGSSVSAIELTRGPAAARTSQLAVAAPTPSSLAPAPAKEHASTASRTLAGALLMGEVADRPVLQLTRPDYPEWAKRDAVEATVTLRFVVLPDGRVKENVRVERTSGYAEFDQNAQTALRAWRFEALKGAGAQEQWGTITFRFQLRDAQS